MFWFHLPPSTLVSPPGSPSPCVASLAAQLPPLKSNTPQLAYEANTDFLFPGLYGALYSFPQPAVQQTLAFGQCVTYTTMPGDDAGTVAYVWHKGASPLSVLFDNGAALEANGWTMGKALPVGLPLDVCNNRESERSDLI